MSRVSKCTLFSLLFGPVFAAWAGGVVLINEVMYHPSGDAPELEFVELFNTLCYDLDLSGWALDGGVEYTFPDGTFIPAEGYLVVASSPSFLGITNAVGPFSGQLSNGGERIRLENNSGRRMDEIDFGDGGDWPVAPDGSDASLAKIDPFSASAPAENWHSGGMGGSPGFANFSSSDSGAVEETTLISKSAVWKYRDLGTDPGSEWMLSAYDDSSWSEGPSPLGYTDSWITTTVSYGSDSGDKYPTTYFRYHFDVTDPTAFSSLLFNAMMDDGAVLYLNGTEFARVRMDSGPITYLDYSTGTVGGSDENVYESISLPVNLLVAGENILAAEVHQRDPGSSDLAFSAQLIGQEILMPDDSLEYLLDDPLLVINEMAGVTNSAWWVELKNESDEALDPAGYVLSVAGDPAREYMLPDSSVPAGGFLLLTSAELGFSVIDDEPIFLYRPGGESLADARVAKRSLRGRCDGEWLRPASPTPESANVFELNRDIVINEIMYHHQATNDGVVFAESDEEWVELYNRGAGPINLSGWAFDDGIDYEFPAGTLLAAGEYLVVGDFSGTLGNGGERLRLVDASGNPADEVHYFDGGRWPERSDGNGSSLELRDPFADNSRAEAWAASDESGRSGWQNISYEVEAAESLAVGPDGRWEDFVIGLLDAGEVLLDDISVVADPGGADTQLISSRDFESGTGDWRIVGNHRHSEVIADPDDSGNQVLRLVATGATDHMHNHAEITLADGQSVENGTTYRISFRAKWIGGSRLLNTRLYFNRAPKTHVLDVPMNNGTPGAQNSTYAANAGPTFDALRHAPAVPNASEEVTVSILADDPQGVVSASVWYSVNGGSWQESAMTDNGAGLFSATVPGQSSADIVQFYVEAEDGLGAVTTFPSGGADSGALYQVNDGQADAALHNFRIILTQENADWMDNSLNYMSNDQIPATVISREKDIYYNVGVRFKGSLYGRYADLKAGFRVGFNADQLFNGVLDNVSVDRSALVDVSRMPETLLHLAMNRAGGEMTKYSDWIKVIIPISGHSNPAQLQLGHYSDVFLDGQFENGGDGDLFEFEYVYYPTAANDDGYKLFAGDGGTIRAPIQRYGDDKESYRNTFTIKNNRAHDDYSGLMEFAGVMGSTGSAFSNEIDRVADVDQWLRYFAYGNAVSLSDNFAHGDNHNAFFYRRPSDGRFLYFTHDLDHKYATPALVPGSDYLEKMIAASPGWERLYYAHVRDILETAWNPAYMQQYTDQFAALIPGGDWSGFLDHIDDCYTTISAELEAAVAPSGSFAVTSDAGTVDALSTTVSGDGWLDVYEIVLEGQDVPLSLNWTASGSGSSRTFSWSAEVPLDPGVNTLTFLAYDFQGNLVGSHTVTITSTASGNPLQDHLRVTELMVNPAGGSDYEFIELYNTGAEALNLSGVHFSSGVDFSFSGAGFTNLEAGESCVVVKDLAAFASLYDTNGITVAGEYSGKLANEGETIEILGSLNEEILRFTYSSGRGWPVAADGAGHALVPTESALGGERAGSLYHGRNWRAGNWIGGSPGEQETAIVSTLLLNEIVAHTDYADPDHPEYDSNDQIELFSNSGMGAVLGAGWYLSDDADALDKWAIPEETAIAPYGYAVFDEISGFHSPITNGFGIDKAGERIFLSWLPESGAGRVVDAVRFKGQENGASFGRYEDGGDCWYTQNPTAGTSNTKPALCPVISEIMFHPVDGLSNNVRDEYVEVYNPSAVSVNLWNESGAWRMDGGIDFDFPTNTMLSAGETIVLVSFDPADSELLGGFLSAYDLTDGAVSVLGPYSGQLDNRGERIALERPQAGDFVGDPVSWVIVDEVIYFHQSPWPEGADGSGRSLQRRFSRWAGNDPESWYASFAPSPGSMAETFGSYGVPDWWLAEYVPGATNDFAAAAVADPDSDGLTTEEEYVAGTDPMDYVSCLRMSAAGGSVSFPTLEAGWEYNGQERRYTLKAVQHLIDGIYLPVPGYEDIAADGLKVILPIRTEEPSTEFFKLEVRLNSPASP